jgi:hypothetical protein
VSRSVTDLARRVASAVALLALVSCGGDSRVPETGSGAGSDGAVEDAGIGGSSSAEPRADEGWQELFDGSSLAGWRGFGSEGPPVGHWVVEDGCIRKVASGNVPTQDDGQPLQGGDLMSIDAWSDFELELEWRVSAGGNSGVKYNVSEELSRLHPPERAALGFEYQILDDDRHADGEIASHRAGALYDLVAPDVGRKHPSPVGEWNRARIVFAGGRGEHWLNGEKLVEFDVASEEFRAAYEASKYLPIEGFADLRRGHVVLQDHGDDAWFRNIRIRPVEGQHDEHE